MEFTRRTGRTLRVCRITFNHPESRLRFTLYPMFHIGRPEFYAEISRDLPRFRYLLLEGVTWRDRPPRHLFDLAAEKLGLAAQEKALVLPPTAERINVDMPRDEFRPLFERLPAGQRFVLTFLRRVLWALSLFPALRRSMRLAFVQKESLADHREPWMREARSLLVMERDACIADRIETFFREHRDVPTETYAAVLFGAAHMPAIAARLHRLGLTPGSRKWLDVLGVDDRPEPTLAERVERGLARLFGGQPGGDPPGPR